MTAEEAAELIQHGDVLGMGGFTATGVPKAVPFALAQRAEKLHAQGIPFRVGLETGASMGDSCDGALARAHDQCRGYALLRHAPVAYGSGSALRIPAETQMGCY